MDKAFRSSWGPQLSLVSLCTQQCVTKTYENDTTVQLEPHISVQSFDNIALTSTIQRLQIIGGSILDKKIENFKKTSIEGHLLIQLQHSTIEEYEHCPMVTIMTDTSSKHALQEHKTHSLKVASNLEDDSLMAYFGDVWRLCEALWGDLSNLVTSLHNVSHETVMSRKEALSNWLKVVTAETVQCEIASMKEDDEIILSLLSANKMEEACNTALKAGDHSISLLLSQLGGTNTIRKLIKQQIQLWQDGDVDNNLSLPRIKLFMLVAGISIISRKNETINVCHNFDWKRSLAIYLWYLSPSTASVTDVLDLYDASFTATSIDTYSSSPWPDYFKYDFNAEISSGKTMYDLCYHLLKLYCTGNHPLEMILNPQAYTYDPLDYRLSWLLLQMLVGLGYNHLSDHVSALINSNFVAQLESFDLWHWAVFVALHFENSDKRHKTVFDLLLRHVQLDKTSDYIERESFLEMKLKVPMKWINEAKAIKSCALRRYGEAAWYFIYSQKWNEAHEVIVEHLATEAIINDDHHYLRSLLDLLITNKGLNTISRWVHEGQLLWDYIIITTEIKHFLSAENSSDIGYKLESLQPQLISLCTKITKFPCPTMKHRLCQAEMAKRTLQLARGLLMCQLQEERFNDLLVQLISQLPLPEDYAQQELRPIINICLKDMIL